MRETAWTLEQRKEFEKKVAAKFGEDSFELQVVRDFDVPQGSVLVWAGFHEEDGKKESWSYWAIVGGDFFMQRVLFVGPVEEVRISSPYAQPTKGLVLVKKSDVLAWGRRPNG